MTVWTADQFTPCTCGHQFGHHDFAEPHACRLYEVCGCEAFLPPVAAEKRKREVTFERVAARSAARKARA